MEISKYSSGYGKADIYQGLNYEEYRDETTSLKVLGKTLIATKELVLLTLNFISFISIQKRFSILKSIALT